MSRLTRVLCVHEDRLSLNTRKKVLENAGFNVDWSGTGMKGLVQFRFFTPDIVVLDYELPDIAGDIVALGMRRINAPVPLLMVAPNIFIPASAIAAADAWILKGDSPEILLAKIHELLGNTRSIAA
jgi:DNA-binding response OmpR family regulator